MMNKNENLTALIDKAIAGDRDSLETVILSVRDMIFNMSLRMLGTFHDAEDATKDIILKVITHLSSFKQESSFSTCVFRIATNHLINYKKHIPDLSVYFSFNKLYESSEQIKRFLTEFLESTTLSTVKNT